MCQSIQYSLNHCETAKCRKWESEKISENEAGFIDQIINLINSRQSDKVKCYTHWLMLEIRAFQHKRRKAMHYR